MCTSVPANVNPSMPMARTYRRHPSRLRTSLIADALYRGGHRGAEGTFMRCSAAAKGIVLALVASSLVGCVGIGGGSDDQPAPSTTAVVAEEGPPGSALIDDLVVAAPDPAAPDYVRDRFGDDWAYDPTTGCNT